MKTNLNILFIAILQLVLLGSCKNNGNSVAPQFLFDEKAIPVAEDDPDGTVSIPVYLSGESDRSVSVDYSTVDSTAVAGKDYVAITSGSLTFQPGELGKEIKLNILPDTAGKKDVYFSIKLSNPVNGIITRSRIKIKIINVDYVNLAWSDEFNLSALNTTFWNYEQGAGGWGNNELQTYTNSLDNVHIDTGYLHITAINPSGTSYTSGRITTLSKKEFTYGRIDIRAKTPEGQGIWPALWMMGSNLAAVGWPRCGETDIMELLGHEPSIVHGTAHWFSNDHQSRSNSYTLSTGKFSTGFHVFSVIWTPNKLVWLVDKHQYFYLTRDEMPNFPFDLPQFIICNVAVGGNWPGVPDATTVFPQHLIVDYVRLYQ